MKKKLSMAEFDNDSDEECKELPNPEKTPHTSTVIRKQSNPYSASEKIAELGLGQAAIEKKVKSGGSPTFSISTYPDKGKGGLGQAVKKQSSLE